ncbi:hypothetical protein CR513_00801, partial [Mucuna pruriens]
MDKGFLSFLDELNKNCLLLLRISQCNGEVKVYIVLLEASKELLPTPTHLLLQWRIQSLPCLDSLLLAIGRYLDIGPVPTRSTGHSMKSRGTKRASGQGSFPQKSPTDLHLPEENIQPTTLFLPFVLFLFPKQNKNGYPHLSYTISKNISFGGRISMIIFLIDNLPMYLFSLYKAPKMIAQIKWNIVYQPKEVGELGVRDLDLFNTTLLGI